MARSFLGKSPQIKNDTEETSPLWAALPLLLGLGAGIATKNVPMGLVAGGLGSVNALGRINTRNKTNRMNAADKAAKAADAAKLEGAKQLMLKQLSLDPSLSPLKTSDLSPLLKRQENTSAYDLAGKMSLNAGGQAFPEMTGAPPPPSFTNSALTRQMDLMKFFKNMPTQSQIQQAMKGEVPAANPTESISGNTFTDRMMKEGVSPKAAAIAHQVLKNQLAVQVNPMKVQKQKADTKKAMSMEEMAAKKALHYDEILGNQLKSGRLTVKKKEQSLPQSAEKHRIYKTEHAEKVAQAEAVKHAQNAIKQLEKTVKDPQRLESDKARIKLQYLGQWLTDEEKTALQAKARITRSNRVTPVKPTAKTQKMDIPTFFGR